MNEIDPKKLMPKPAFFMRALIWIAGVDEETLRQCPEHDWDCVRASALLFVAVWIYQTAIFGIVGQQLFARDGQFHPVVLLGAAFLATFILLLDSFVFNRASYYGDGLYELKRGGLDLGNVFWTRLKALFFLALRILVLSLAIAQLTAIFFGLILFRADIAADQERQFQQQNAALIVKAHDHVDTEIADARAAVSDSEAQVAALQKQVNAMRNGAVYAAAGDPAIEAAQDELRQLMAEKARRDEALETAHKYSSAELAGEKVETGNSGIPGRGPVRMAAEERVRAAARDVQDVDDAILSARKRFDDLRAQLAPSDGDRSQRSKQMLPDLERDLTAESNNLHTLRTRLEALTTGRDQQIRDEVENAPNCVKESVGFIGQLRSLRRIAQDPEIAAIIILIDVTSFGLELAAVLAKCTTYLPMEYSARLALNAYTRVVRLAREGDREINGPSIEPANGDDDLPPLASSADNTDDTRDGLDDLFGAPVSFEAPSESNDPGLTGTSPAKRPRGRPRKYPLPVTV